VLFSEFLLEKNAEKVAFLLKKKPMGQFLSPKNLLFAIICCTFATKQTNG